METAIPAIAEHSGDQVASLQQELDEANATAARLQAEQESMKEQMLRLRAEFDNYRKRTLAEKEQLRQVAIQSFLEQMIPVLDSFDHASQAIEKENNLDTLTKGFRAIQSLLENLIGAHGVERIEPRGQAFDPNIHEAMAVVKTDEYPENTVIDVLQNGYTLNGRLIRPARVRVAQKP